MGYTALSGRLAVLLDNSRDPVKVARYPNVVLRNAINPLSPARRARTLRRTDPYYVPTTINVYERRAATVAGAADPFEPHSVAGALARRIESPPEQPLICPVYFIRRSPDPAVVAGGAGLTRAEVASSNHGYDASDLILMRVKPNGIDTCHGPLQLDQGDVV